MFSHQGPNSGTIASTLSARVCGLSSLGGEDQSLRGQICVLPTLADGSPITCACDPPRFFLCLDGRVRTPVYQDGEWRMIVAGRKAVTCNRCGVTVAARKGVA